MHLTMFAFEHHSKIITQHKFASECHNIATTVIAQSPLKLSIDGQCNRKKVTQHIQPAQFFSYERRNGRGKKCNQSFFIIILSYTCRFVLFYVRCLVGNENV